jgi:hypothetical protein
MRLSPALVRVAAFFLLCAVIPLAAVSGRAADREDLHLGTINVEVPHVSSDPSVRLDYDIVYVRAPRAGDRVHKRFYTDFSQPVTMEPGADLMLLHPDLFVLLLFWVCVFLFLDKLVLVV